MTAPRAQVCLDLPEAWRPVSVAPDGDRPAQRALLDAWIEDAGATRTGGSHGDRTETPPTRRPEFRRLETQLVRESRRASRDGIRFAAVLLDLGADGSGTVLLAASLTVSFRLLPGARDPLVAAQGTLAALRAAPVTGYPTRRAELVGLGRDETRPAALVRDLTTGPDDPATRLSVTQVLWLVPSSSQLACVSVASPNVKLPAELADVALSVAASLHLEREVTRT